MWADRVLGSVGWRVPLDRVLVPAVVLALAGAVWLGPRERVLGLTIGVVVAAGVVAWTWRVPARAAAVLVAALPFQLVVLAKLYDLGLPAMLADQASNAKELVLVTLVLVVVSDRRPADLDRVDRVALAYVAVLSLYLAAALLLAPFVGDLFPRAPDDVESLARSYRTNAGFVVFFLVLRRLPMTRVDVEWLVRAALGAAVVVGLGGMLEYADPALWRRWVVDWAGVRRFSSQVLGGREIGGTVTQPLFGGSGGATTRVSSFLFSPLVVGFHLLSGLGLGLVRAARRPTLPRAIAVAAMGGTIVLTSTRSAALAAAVTVVAGILAVPAAQARARLVLGAIAGLFVAVVVASTTGLATRFLSVLTGDDPSATGHREATAEALELVVSRPLGLGLGSGPTVAGRDLSERVISENAYLQVGIEVGVLGMVLFVALLVLVVTQLLERARRGGGLLVSGAAAAGLGLALGGMFLHVWNDIPTAWTFWGLAGVALHHDRQVPA